MADAATAGDPERTTMTGVIDYWCNDFTPEGVRGCFAAQEEVLVPSAKMHSFRTPMRRGTGVRR